MIDELAAGEVPDGLRIVFGDNAVDGPVVRFASRRRHPDDLLVAPDGDGLWRRAPWPAADTLFELSPPVDAAPVLMVGDDGTLARAAGERGVSVIDADVVCDDQLVTRRSGSAPVSGPRLARSRAPSESPQ